MAFDLYFAGIQNMDCENYLLNNHCCRLYSQLNDRKNIKYWTDTDFKGKLFIDSGAYTCYTKKVDVDVDDYINYINSIDNKVTLFAQVDKIPGNYGEPKTIQQILEAPEISWENYLYMRQKVKSPDKLLPIFHRREDFKYLKQMLETTFDGKYIPYIGIAATTDSSVKEKKEWFDKVFEIIKNSSNPNVKTHAFGMTSLKLLEKYPFTSADSTSWIMTGANGAIMTPFGTIYVSQSKSNELNYITHLSKEALLTLQEYLHSLGLTFEEVSTDYKQRMLANIKYLKNWCDNYEYKPASITRINLF